MLVSTFPEDLPCLVGILLGGSGGIKKLLRVVARRSGTEEINDTSGELRESSEVDFSRMDSSLKQGSSLRGVCCITLDFA